MAKPIHGDTVLYDAMRYLGERLLYAPISDDAWSQEQAAIEEALCILGKKYREVSNA